MSAVFRPRCTCGRPSGIVRHANPGDDHTPSFRTAFRVTLVAILVAALAGHWIGWALGWITIAVVITGLYAAATLGIIK